jgi:hypothetical protein
MQQVSAPLFGMAKLAVRRDQTNLVGIWAVWYVLTNANIHAEAAKPPSFQIIVELGGMWNSGDGQMKPEQRVG